MHEDVTAEKPSEKETKKASINVVTFTVLKAIPDAVLVVER